MIGKKRKVARGIEIEQAPQKLKYDPDGKTFSSEARAPFFEKQ